jgi:hypothetical protein
MATQATSINSSGTLYVAGGIDEVMIGTGSVQFNGVNQSLSVVNPVIATGTNNFTIEAWVYVPGVIRTASPTIASTTIGNSNAGFHWYFGVNGFGVRSYTINIVLPANSGAAGQLVANTWYHCAYTRLGNVHSCWLNGVLTNSATYSVNFSDSTLTIGNASVGQFFGGYISNLRLINGTAIYTSNFTVPTAPLNTLYNTTFLMNKIYGQSNTNNIIDSSVYNSTVTNVNSAIPVNVNPFYTGEVGSLSFNSGGNQYQLSGGAGSAIDLSTGAPNWTVESWFYLNDIASDYALFWKGGTSGSTNPSYSFQISTGGTGQFIIGDAASGGGGIAPTVSSISANTWYHFALIRNGSWIIAFLNGVIKSTNAIAFTQRIDSNPLLTIGSSVADGSRRFFNGYITNFRITKGISVYATNTNFVPPTQPLTVMGTQTGVLLSTPFASSSTVFKDSSVNNFTVISTGTTSTVFSPFTSNLSNAPTLLNTVERISTQGLQTTGEIDEITLVSGSVNLSTAWVRALNSTSFRTQNLTMECWFYPTAANPFGMIMGGRSAANGGFGDINIFQVSNALNLYISPAGGSWTINGAVAGGYDVNRWHHLAMVRNSSTFTVYLNGTSTYVNSSFNLDFTRVSQPMFIGGNDYLGGPSDVFAGYISNARVVVGTAVYTSNFTPPAAPLTAITGTFWLLSTPYNNNYLRDFSTSTSVSLTAGTVTRSNLSPFSTLGSLQFNGTNQYLNNSGALTTFAFGTGDFTVEYWVYYNSLQAAYQHIAGPNTLTSNNGFAFGIYGDVTGTAGSGRLYLTTSLVSYFTDKTISTGQWYHVAFVRVNGWVRSYANGIGSTPIVGTVNCTDTGISIAALPTLGSYYSNAYVSNLRVIKGVAVYNTNTNFTLLTRPLTVMGTQTSLLLTTPLGTNAFTDSSLYNLSLTNNNATISTIFNPFTDSLGNPPTTVGTVQRVSGKGLQVSGSFDEFSMNRGSVLLNGSSQYLTIPTSAAFQFATDNFTAEGWVYRSAAWTAQNIFLGQWSGSTGGTTLSWVVMTSNDINGYARFLLGSVSGSAVLTDSVSSTVIPLNQWNHIAFVRNSNIFTLYLNGISVVTYSIGTPTVSAATNVISIGASSAGTQPFSGYISNVRIVKGVAVYTSNFTRPTRPFSSTDVYSTQTSILLNTVAYPPLNTIDNSLNNFTVTPVAAPQPSELNPFV